MLHGMAFLVMHTYVIAAMQVRPCFGARTPPIEETMQRISPAAAAVVML